MEKLDKIKDMKNNESHESVPTDMHADGVHFNTNVLAAKRSESARSEDDSSDMDESLDSKSNNEDDKVKHSNDSKKSKEEIIKDMDGGYNRDAPINDKQKS
ncbi:MAG: hypothetical protein WA775_09715 [Psychroserpens sp.]|uniref:hypothetical protein n=1 Tax=Psychroserpens sp. TaxID=2020870 RepID=UPI003C747A0C